MAITSIFKNIVIYLRVWIKLILMFLVGLAIIGFIVFVVYKPMYSVTLDGEFIGYTEDKGRLQKKINNYLKSGDSKTVAFVEIDNYPEYDLCLLKKGLTANDDEIFTAVINSGVPYYKYYAIVEDGQEKFYVSSYEEADSIINELKSKNSQNKDTVTCVLKYETELKTFTDTATTVASLYKEMPVVKKTKYVTEKRVSYENTALGIALIEPVHGTITSRFGRRSGGTHTGLDIANSKGTPIKAAATGTVIYTGYKGSYGNLIVIDHNNGIHTYYAACSKLHVEIGQEVKQGDIIAEVGATGNATGPHLHFELRINGNPLNPSLYLK